MIIVQATQGKQEIKVVPRHFPCTVVGVVITDSFSGVVTVAEVPYREWNNKLSVTIDYLFVENRQYQIIIVDNYVEVRSDLVVVPENIVYRGILMFTSQDTQEYESSKDYYTY